MTAAHAQVNRPVPVRSTADLSGTSGEPREDQAVIAAVSVIPGWWRQRAEASGLSGEWLDWRRALPEPPVPVPADGPTPLVDDPWSFGQAYTEALQPQTRNRCGRHYTPRLLSEALWAEVQLVTGTASPDRIVDPAAGSGALLLPAVRQYVAGVARTSDPHEVLDEVTRTFAGTELDPVGAWIGNAVLAAELLPLWARLPEDQRAPLPCMIRVGDGLAPADDRPAVVILNPPYGRVRLDTADRARWRTLWGHANVYQLFLESALDRVADGGVVGAVLPTSWTGGAYYQRLRSYIAKVAPLSRVTWISDRNDVFSGVLQETCLAVFRKKPGLHGVHVSRQLVNGAVHSQRVGTAELPVDPGQAWLLPRTAGDVRLVRAAARFSRRLADYGWRASTGPLVWNRHKAQISEGRRASSLPIVWASDIDTGAVAPDPRRDQQRWIELEPRQRPVMVLDRPAILVQRTTAPEQARRLVVAILDQATLDEWGGEVVVENHVNVLRCTDGESPLSMALLAALLRTDVVDRLFRSLSGSVAVSAYELGALPLPEPATLDTWQGLGSGQLGRAVHMLYQYA